MTSKLNVLQNITVRRVVKGIRISILIPVYEQWEHCSSLIRTILLEMASIEHAELIVIDNGSIMTPRIENDEKFTLLKCNKPGSYAARNLGLSQAKGDLILFTDADCLPSKKWIEFLVTAYVNSDKKTLLAGNVIVRGNIEHPSTAELYDIATGLPQERYVSQGYAVTANLAIPRVVFDEIGLFDEQRFSGGDAEFCQRAIKAGYKLQFVPEAVVYHPARKTWQEFAIKVRRMKGGQIRAGNLQRRIKYGLITLLPPIWRFWRTCRSDKLTVIQKLKVVFFQVRLWFVEVVEMFALLLGKQPERR